MFSTHLYASLRLLPIRRWRFSAFVLFTAALGVLPLTARADALDDSLVLFVRSLDTTRDGLVSREELSARLSQAKTNGTDERSMQALQMMTRGFSLMDTNRDGQLSAAEISAGINMRFANADRNNNGTLTQEEASGGMPMVARNFAAIDTRGSGSVSLSQVRDFMAQSMKSAVAAVRAP